jgi:DNA uptake protein ComE-like DNA-binding protein
MSEENLKLDPNTADQDTLTLIPGIGPDLAERIVAARPFQTVDELQRVNGIGPAFLNRISPMLVTWPPKRRERSCSLTQATTSWACLHPQKTT